jgi:ATP-dependent DNA helicase PIF1
MNERERQVINLLQKNRFVLVSGEAGTGKSFLLKSLNQALQKIYDKVVLCAPTGVAAINVGGTTLHSWFGMGLASEDVSVLKKRVNFKTQLNLRTTQVLMIDEISMVQPDFFEKISQMIQHVNGNFTPFGNMRVVMFGDFLQLPPISQNIFPKYVFQTSLWTEMQVKRIFLTKNFRQQKDDFFLEMLNEVRCGIVSQSMMGVLRNRINSLPNFGHDVDTAPVTRLCCYRNKVETYNVNRLKALDDEDAVEFDGVLTPEKSKNCYAGLTPLDRKHSQQMIKKADKIFPVPLKILLKKNAQVMMRCNVFLENHGVCNGSLGVVKNFGSGQTVFVDFGHVVLQVTKHLFSFDCGNYSLKLFQMPLTLSWAMTVHKSQGLTIDRVLIDTDCFENGQLYTALSRVKKLENLHLSSFHKKGLKVDPAACAFEKRPSVSDENTLVLL